MNIKDLNEILSCVNLSKIENLLLERGYRNASKNGVWEFDPVAIANASNVQDCEIFEDFFNDKIYTGNIVFDVKEYPEITFIVITISQTPGEKNQHSLPIEILLFTNATINNEYEREQSRILRCEICKRKFPTRELCEINGKLICDSCFEKDLKRVVNKGKSKLIR